MHAEQPDTRVSAPECVTVQYSVYRPSHAALLQMVVEHLKMSIVGSGLVISIAKGTGVTPCVGAGKHGVMNKQIPNTANKYT